MAIDDIVWPEGDIGFITMEISESATTTISDNLSEGATRSGMDVLETPNLYRHPNILNAGLQTKVVT